MNKELTKEEAEEFYNKLWLENKELIQDNMNKLSMERFELELELVDKDKEIERLHSIIKEVREYITSYESIETIQQFDHNKNNKDLDYSTIDEMTRRYMIVHDKVLKILDKADKENK